MASYRYNSFKFPAAALAGVDADAVKGLRSYLTARESALNTVETSSMIYDNGPFAGQSVELASAGTLPLNVKGWIGYYDAGQWHGTTGEPLAMVAPVGALAKHKDTGTMGKGFAALGDLFGELAEDPEERAFTVTRQVTIGIDQNGQDDYGFALTEPRRAGVWSVSTPQQRTFFERKNGRRVKKSVIIYNLTCHDKHSYSSLFMDDFGDLVNAPALNNQQFVKIPMPVKMATYTIGKTRFTIRATAQGVDNLRAKILAKKRWFADKFVKPLNPEELIASSTPEEINQLASQDVAQVVAMATAAAAIEQASESAALQEVASTTPQIDQAATMDQADQVAHDARELETVCEDASQASQNSAGATNQTHGHIGASTSSQASSARHAGSVAHRGQAINSKSGNWRAAFFTDDNGRPAMVFNGGQVLDFESGSARMKALQALARHADTDAAARVCHGQPAEQMASQPDQNSPVPNSETPQDQAPARESESPQDAAAPTFERFKPVNMDPRALLASGLSADQLIGLGVQYTGNMANPDGTGAITEVSDTRRERFGSLRITVSLEDGRVIHAEPHYFTADLRPICQFNGMMHGAPYLAQLAAAVATIKAQASAAKEQADKAHAQALIDLAAQYPQLQRVAPGQHGNGKLCAINIRILLKEAFKGHKFSVTSDYNSVRVGWTDGPTDAEVNALIGRFDIGASDTQTDYFYTVSTAFSELFGGVQYLNTYRDVSDALVTKSLDSWWPTRGESATAAAPTAQDWIKGTGVFCWVNGCDYLRACFRKHLGSISTYKAPAAKARAKA
jgi:hypothetical protein